MATSFEHILTATLSPMEGWCTTEKALALAEHIEQERMFRCLEIGVFGGKSLLAMAMAQAHAGLDTSFSVGVDPWRNVDCIEGEPDPRHIEWWSRCDLHVIHRKCMEAIWATGLADRVIIIRNNSTAASQLLAPMEWDLIHIDGNHSEVASVRDVQLWSPRLRQGGVLVFDDLNWSNGGTAVSMLNDSMSLITKIGDCGFFRKPA